MEPCCMKQRSTAISAMKSGLKFAIQATRMAVKPRPFAVLTESVCPAPPTITAPARPQIAPEMAMVRSMTRCTEMPA